MTDRRRGLTTVGFFGSGASRRSRHEEYAPCVSAASTLIRLDRLSARMLGSPTLRDAATGAGAKGVGTGARSVSMKGAFHVTVRRMGSP